MLQPSPEQLATLPPVGRVAFKIADRLSSVKRRHINDAFMGTMIWSCGGRRLHVEGLEHVTRLGNDASILFVANHRSFFDFYLVNAILAWRTDFRRRALFPVRYEFFYDHPLGPFVNMAMSGMRMFPPVSREKARSPLNQFALARCAAELERPGTMMGVHPEGTRNKGDDPYTFLPAQPGVGRIALEARAAHVMPVFLLGMSSSLPREFTRNWTRPGDFPIHAMFGPEVDLDDLRHEKPRPALAKRAADRCMAAIARLAEDHRARYA
jgi:1-acyl-sn-glycerol-3-phosphate acyltransferase